MHLCRLVHFPTQQEALEYETSLKFFDFSSIITYHGEPKLHCAAMI